MVSDDRLQKVRSEGRSSCASVQQALIHLVYDLNPGNFIIPGVFYRLTAVRSV